MIDAQPVELLLQFILRLGAVAEEGVEFLLAAQGHFADLAGLGILQRHPAEGGQLFLMWVGDLDGHHIVPAAGLLQGGDGEGVEEIDSNTITERRRNDFCKCCSAWRRSPPR